MSGPSVVIGFILLVPSIFGMLFGLLTSAGMIIGATNDPTRQTTVESVRRTLAEQQVPSDIVNDVAEGRHISETRLTPLSFEQRSAVHTAERKITDLNAVTGIAACCGGTFSVMIIVGSFIGGLLGWLLIMRKTVLQCTRCGAVVAAS